MDQNQTIEEFIQNPENLRGGSENSRRPSDYGRGTSTGQGWLEVRFEGEDNEVGPSDNNFEIEDVANTSKLSLNRDEEKTTTPMRFGSMNKLAVSTYQRFLT